VLDQSALYAAARTLIWSRKLPNIPTRQAGRKVVMYTNYTTVGLQGEVSTELIFRSESSKVVAWSKHIRPKVLASWSGYRS